MSIAWELIPYAANDVSARKNHDKETKTDIKRQKSEF